MSGVSQFFNNLFGAIAGNTVFGRVGNKDFIPNGKGGDGVFSITGKGMQASWLGLRNPMMQKYAYEYCYPVSSVCDRLAEADTTGVIEILKIKGKGKEDFAKSDYAVKMNKLLTQPNVMQTWDQFRGQQVVYKKIFGFCPVLPIIPAGYENYPEEASALINLPPWLFEPIGTGKLLYQTKIEDIVKEYRISLLGSAFVLKPNQVFILEDSFLQDDQRGFLVPKSRLCGLDMAVSNLCAAMESDNVLLRRSGPVGLLTPDNKDAMGTSLPMTDEQKLMAQEDLQQYGITWTQFQYMISRNPMQLQTIGFNAKQLGSKETIVASEKAVCHRLNYSYVLYEDSGATYANQDGAHKALYQNNVIPGAYKDINKYNKFFKAEDNQCVIKVDYSHLPVLQENEKDKADAAVAWNGALKVEYDNNLITLNDWRTQLGLETVDGGDFLKGDSQDTSPLAIRLGVGGTQALVDLVANPALSVDSKIQSLQILFGLSPQDAKAMVGEPVTTETTTATTTVNE